MSFSNGWIFWILASCLALSFYDLCKKASVRANAVFPTLFFSTVSGWAVLSVFLLATGKMSGVLAVTATDVARLSVKSCLVAASWTSTYLALRTLPITCAAPIRATGPFWTLLGAILLFSERPTAIQGIGMFFVLAGCLFFSLSLRREPASGGVTAIVCAFLGTVLGSCSALYDKHLLQAAGMPALTVLWWFLGGMTLLYAVGAFVSRKGFQWRASIPFVGILLAVSDACYFTAIAVPDAQISVLSLIRRSSIVLTFFIGGALFRETNLLRKAAALSVLLAGVVLLCLSS